MRNLVLLVITVFVTNLAIAGYEMQLPIKLDYAEGVLMRSSTAERIRTRGSDEAKAMLEKARNTYKEARIAQQSGKFALANTKADESLRLVNAAVLLVPNKFDEERAAKRRYAELLHQVETYLQWDHEHSVIDADTQNELDKTVIEMEEAAKYASSSDYKKANEFLNMALAIVISARNKSLKERTFVYDLNFETPIDEYNYEETRNEDYQRLVPVAITQRDPPAGIQSLMQRFVDKALIKRHDAEALFKDKSYEQAVSKMQESTTDLLKALKLAGVQ
ncbi:MAG: hypothetical protein OEZ16_01230 [Chromatiales bacterium]|nr:hypothetical protein [Chromatiales bacterium]